MIAKVSIWPDIENYKWPKLSERSAVLATYGASISGQNRVSQSCRVDGMVVTLARSAGGWKAPLHYL